MNNCALRDIKTVIIFFAAKSKEEAMGDYITKVKQLLEAAGIPA
jgi:hypothetical protein